MPRLSDPTKPGTPPPPSRSPFLPPAPRPQPPPAAPALQQRATAALVLALLSLIAMLLIGNLQRAVYVVAVALAVALVGLLIFWSQYMQYADCLNGASTVATQNACQQQFENSM